MYSKGIDRTKLKYLAIIAMVIDHVAWGFVDFMSPLGQIMHIVGRLTLPIMCFFVAEGYRHTSSIRKYVHRMIGFAFISVIPFYIFFHEEYGLRQNIIFDLTLGLLALVIAEIENWKLPVKVFMITLLVAISIVIGGWIIMPIIYIFIFYYGKTFKQKAVLFSLFTVLMEITLIILIQINHVYHFSRYDWDVSERLYLLGFVIALIPLYFYNGNKGKVILGRYFFYLFYPAHFLVLSAIKYLIIDYNPQRIYIVGHVIALGIAIGCLIYVCTIRNSKAQMATALFLMSAVMYVFGFLLEITTNEIAGVFTATKLEYFAECAVLITITYAIQELSKRRVPKFVYIAEVVVSIIILYYLFTYKQNGLFYSAISINHMAGPFPRMEIESYGIVFYIFLIYAGIVCITTIILGIMATNNSRYDERRLRNLLYAMICVWLPYVIKVSNITKGYEIPAFGVAFAAFFVCRSLGKYSYLNSVNFTNAINYGSEGILVIDNREVVTYHTEWMHNIFGQFEDYVNVSRIPGAREAFFGNEKTLEVNGHIYELRVEPLEEGGENRGRILWTFDLTEHYKYLNLVKESAETDALTGLNNRGWFESEISKHLDAGHSGTYYILDLDNFKNVNDSFGHGVGDEVLICLANVLKKHRNNKLLAGRIGGDEFCLFYKDEIDEGVLSALAETLIYDFSEALDTVSCGRITAITVGMAVVNQEKEEEPVSYSKAYKWADRALYIAKEAGKQTYRFYTQNK